MFINSFARDQCYAADGPPAQQQQSSSSASSLSLLKALARSHNHHHIAYNITLSASVSSFLRSLWQHGWHISKRKKRRRLVHIVWFTASHTSAWSWKFILVYSEIVTALRTRVLSSRKQARMRRSVYQ